MFKALFLLTLIFYTGLTQAEIYTWTDSTGIIHFSDTRQEGAKRYNLPSIQTYQNTNNIQQPSPPSENPSQIQYSVNIQQPSNEATLRSNQGEVAIVTEVLPKFEPTQALQIFLDGQPYGKPQKNPLFALTGINPGTHTLAVELIGAGNRMLAQSPPVTFYMHHTTIRRSGG